MPLSSRGLNRLLADWKGRSAGVGGASSGIGRATAEALHRKGARVIVSARHGGALQDFVRGREGCLALPLDVTDAAAVDAAAQAVLAHAGGAPDLILYCAGHYRPLRATEFDRSEEHTSELQSHLNLVCRLLLEKKKNKQTKKHRHTLSQLLTLQYA